MVMREGSSGPIKVETVEVTADIASVAAATAPDTALTVANARVGDQILIQPLGTWPANLSLPLGRCIVAGTVQMRVVNPTAAPIDPASQTFRVTLLHDTPTGV